jgi:hypothetical protein
VRCFFRALWIGTALFLAWAAGLYYGERMPARYSQPVCVDPYYEWGYDSPAMRLYIYSLNPNACFEYKLTREPSVLGLIRRRY